MIAKGEPLGRLAASYVQAPARPGLLEELSSALRSLVDFDAAVWSADDPLSGLPAVPAHAEGLGPECWEAAWASEFSEQDVLLFRDLARAPVPAGSLHEATEGVPERSPRFRAHLRPLGVTDELRAVFRAGETVWGQVSLLRCAPGRPFAAADHAVLLVAGAAVAAALRARTARPDRSASPAPPGPGTLLHDGQGRRISMDGPAAAWLAALAGEGWDGPARPAAMAAVTAVVARANALCEHGEAGPSVVRARTGDGRWVLLSASGTRTADGEHGLTALHLGAAPPEEVAAVLEVAFALTRRERDVVGALLLGLSNAEIAARLEVSAHTVRDHLATMFLKTRVGSRGELVARLSGA